MHGTGTWGLPTGVTLEYSNADGFGFKWLNGGSGVLVPDKTYKFIYACNGY